VKPRFVEPGDLCRCEPHNLGYNPDKNVPPFVGIFLEKRKEEGWACNELKFLGPNGITWVWSNRWAVEVIHEAW